MRQFRLSHLKSHLKSQLNLPGMKLTISGLIFCLILNALCVLSGCSPSPEDLYQQGSRLTQQKNYQSALQVFKQLGEIAQEDIHKYRALYGQSQVYQRQGDLLTQSELLNQILENQNFSQYQEVVKGCYVR